MSITSKYTTVEKIDAENKAILKDDKIIPTEINKTILSNDAFAITEMIEALINKIEHARVSLK